MFNKVKSGLKRRVAFQPRGALWSFVCPVSTRSHSVDDCKVNEEVLKVGRLVNAR